MQIRKRSSQGFTIIELIIVLVIIGILGTLVALSYNGVKTRERNAERQTAIDTLQSHLETYYASESQYPTLTQINDGDWRSENMPDLNAGNLRDPLWNNEISRCTTDGNAVLVSEPSQNCYAYQVTGSEGAECDNDQTVCAHYTLTATFEDGEPYVKTSLN